MIGVYGIVKEENEVFFYMVVYFCKKGFFVLEVYICFEDKNCYL